MTNDETKAAIAGVILAGGRARRMGGGEKALLPLGGRPMAARVADRIAPHVGALALSANGDEAVYAPLGLPVIRDTAGDYAGPLAGLLSGMDWARREAPGARWVVTAPCDTPFLPEDYVPALLGASAGGEAIMIAASGGRAHYVCGLWPLTLRDDLAAWIAGGRHKMRDWIERHPNREIGFPSASGGAGQADPFFNVNTPEDYALAQALIEEEGA
jgi:molybdopterin-guanine dinucleotide biosynthesis protein A